MTYFMITGIVAFSTVIFLLACFRGFSRDLKRGETVGLLVQPVSDRRAALKHNMRRMIHTSMQTQRDSRRNPSNASPGTLVTYKDLRRA
jgi:hypothetical protein